MASEKEFNRSVCFTFFEDYLQHVENVEKEFGVETAYEVLITIAKYGLYKELPKDNKMKILVNSTILKSLDLSQDRRAKGFKGEDTEKTQAVIDYYRDHPDASQNEIAEATGISKGKVNKVLQRLRKEEENENNNSYSSSNTTSTSYTDATASSTANAVANANSGVTATVTGSAASHTADATLNEAYASTTQQQDETEKELTYEEKLEKYKRDMITYKESIQVMELFRKHMKPREIEKSTGFNILFVNMSIDEYRANGNKFPEPPEKPKNILKIPTLDGTTHEMDLDEFNPKFSCEQEAKELYKLFVDPNYDYKFEPEFTAKWFKDYYGIDVTE